MPPVKIIVYDFLRRHYPHQVIGSKVIPSSQPVSTSSPVFICIHYTSSVWITQDAIMLKVIIYGRYCDFMICMGAACKYKYYKH